jgi:hypothetical protein
MNAMNNNTNATTVSTDAATTPPPATTPPATSTPTGKARVAVSFLLRASDAELIVASLCMITAMTGNAAYASPNPALADIVAARNTFITAVNAAKDSRLAVTVRRKQRIALVTLLRNLALYVQSTCGGDLSTLLSSGFSAQRSRQPIGELPAPANLRLTRGKVSGQIVARFEKLPRAGAYEWRYATTAAPTVWVTANATLAARTTLDGLVPGTQYIVQVRAVGTAGPSDWSDAVVLMAA